MIRYKHKYSLTMEHDQMLNTDALQTIDELSLMHGAVASGRFDPFKLGG